jgi:hypothetical protein
LTDDGDGVYLAKVPEPEQGWTAYFVEMTFPSTGRYPYKFTTGVRVVPDKLPSGRRRTRPDGTNRPRAARHVDAAALFQALGGSWCNRTDVAPVKSVTSS